MRTHFKHVTASYRRLGVAAASAAFAVTALAACGTDSAYVDEEGRSSNADASSYNTAKDVKMGKCELAEYGEIAATVKITNHDDKPRSYMVTAEAVNAKGDRISELNAVSNSVRPGQSVEADASGYTDDESVKIDKCKIVSIDSFRD